MNNIFETDSSDDDPTVAFRTRRQDEADAAAESFRARRQDEADAAIERRSEWPEVAQKVSALAREKPGSARPSRRYPEHRSSRVGNVLSNPGILYGGIAALATSAAIGYGFASDATYGEDRAESFVEGQGYTDVEAVSKSLFLVGWQGCSDGDGVKYSIEATGADGEETEVLVCKGFLKGATLRQK